jgi:hypothetical protein
MLSRRGILSRIGAASAVLAVKPGRRAQDVTQCCGNCWARSGGGGIAKEVWDRIKAADLKVRSSLRAALAF